MTCVYIPDSLCVWVSLGIFGNYCASVAWALHWLSITLDGQVWKPQLVETWCGLRCLEQASSRCRCSHEKLCDTAWRSCMTPFEASDLPWELRLRGLFPQIHLCHTCWLRPLLHFARASHGTWPGYDAPTRPLVFCKLHEADRWGRPRWRGCGSWARGSNLRTYKLVSLLCTTQCFLLMCSCFDVWMMVKIRPAQLQLHLQIGKIFFSLLPFFHRSTWRGGVASLIQ